MGPTSDVWLKVVEVHLERNFSVRERHSILAGALMSHRLTYIKEYGRCLLFDRIQELSGCKFLDSAMNILAQDTVPENPFDISSLIGFSVRVKHTVGVTNAKGSFYYMKSLKLIQMLEFEEALIMLKSTKHIFESSLRSSPNNKETLVQLARTCRRILELETLLSSKTIPGSAKELEILFSSYTFNPSPVVEETIRHLRRSVELDGSDDSLRFFYGCFLIQCMELGDACDKILQCIQQNPERVEYMAVYALLLTYNGHITEAKQFLFRARFILTCKRIIHQFRTEARE